MRPNCPEAWNDLICLLQEKLWKMLKDAVQNKPNINVVKLHKSEGVVPRNSKYRQKTRSSRIKVVHSIWGRGVPDFVALKKYFS
jgi:hypothetical protein